MYGLMARVTHIRGQCYSITGSGYGYTGYDRIRVMDVGMEESDTDTWYIAD